MIAPGRYVARLAGPAGPLAGAFVLEAPDAAGAAGLALVAWFPTEAAAEAYAQAEPVRLALPPPATAPTPAAAPAPVAATPARAPAASGRDPAADQAAAGKPWRRWSAEHEEMLRRLWHAGAPINQICAAVERPGKEQAVYAKANALGLGQRPDPRSVRRSHAGGDRAPDPAPRETAPPATPTSEPPVAPTPEPPTAPAAPPATLELTADQAATVRRLWADGAVYEGIAATTGLTVDQVKAAREQLGLPKREAGWYAKHKAAQMKMAAVVPPERDEVVLYLRRMDVVVVPMHNGTWLLNARDTVDRAGLVARANKWRERRGEPPFPMPETISEDAA